ncbi:hypothetical protein SDC9_112756 [bioreactor metagenome]|uniref:Uncharacterized protein n=1 Tax=bioreactor metagenome TaxID=1076179 RepID=A0A645BKW7_9ZZZZ
MDESFSRFQHFESINILAAQVKLGNIREPIAIGVKTKGHIVALGGKTQCGHCGLLNPPVHGCKDEHFLSGSGLLSHRGGMLHHFANGFLQQLKAKTCLDWRTILMAEPIEFGGKRNSAQYLL